MHRGAPNGHAVRKLARSASGLRHLRWTREVLGTLAALAAHPEHLTPLQRTTLETEVAHVTAIVAALSAAVKPYRDFLERTRTRTRGKVRAAELLASAPAGIALADAGAGSRALEAARAEMTGVTEPERRRLHASLSRAIDEARAGLAAMDGRLAIAFSPNVMAAIYPPLTADSSRVLDDGDPDDDAAGHHGEM